MSFTADFGLGRLPRSPPGLLHAQPTVLNRRLAQYGHDGVVAVGSRALSWVLPVVAGVASGLIGAMVFSPRAVSTTQPQAVIPTQPPIVRTVYLSPAGTHSLPNPAAATHPASDRNPDPSLEDPAGPEDDARLRSEKVVRHQNAIAAHRQQGRDSRWARASEASLRGDLETLSAAARFEIEEVDCRSTSCISTVRWPNHSAALALWPELLHANYHLGCAREITLPEPADVSQPYHATMVFNCESPRSDVR